jgi:EpsI family protein
VTDFLSRHGVALGALGALMAAAMFVHWDALRSMEGQWSRNQMYSYGYIVPLISGLIFWLRKDAWYGLPAQPAYVPGALVLVFSACLLFVGRAGAILLLEQLALIVTIAGSVLFVFGTRYARAAVPSLCYLLLMVPFWDAFTEPLHWPLQQRSAEMGLALLRALGVPAYREQTLIALPNITLDVARACSGVNYLVAVLALGLPMAYLYLPGVWRRVTLIVGAMAVAVLSNSLRVALIGLLAYHEVGSPLHGPFHVLHGLFVSGIGFVALFAGLGALAPRHGSPAARTNLLLDFRSVGSAVRLPRRAPVLLAAALVVLGVAVRSFEIRPVAPRVSLNALTMNVGRWVVQPVPAARSSVSEAWIDSADDYVLRRFVSDDGRAVDVLVAYFASQGQTREAVNFRAADLHRSSRRRHVSLGQSALEINVVAGDQNRAPAIFWYEFPEGSEAHPYRARVRTLWGALVRNQNPTAVIVLSPVRTAGVADDGLLTEFDDLARELHRTLAEILWLRS